MTWQNAVSHPRCFHFFRPGRRYRSLISLFHRLSRLAGRAGGVLAPFLLDPTGGDRPVKQGSSQHRDGNRRRRQDGRG